MFDVRGARRSHVTLYGKRIKLGYHSEFPVALQRAARCCYRHEARRRSTGNDCSEESVGRNVEVRVGSVERDTRGPSEPLPDNLNGPSDLPEV